MITKEKIIQSLNSTIIAIETMSDKEFKEKWEDVQNLYVDSETVNCEYCIAMEEMNELWNQQQTDEYLAMTKDDET